MFSSTPKIHWVTRESSQILIRLLSFNGVGEPPPPAQEEKRSTFSGTEGPSRKLPNRDKPNTSGEKKTLHQHPSPFYLKTLSSDSLTRPDPIKI